MKPTFAKFPSLDGLRAFSILLVLIGHTKSSIGHIEGENLLIWRIFGNQQLGVSLFFVISGFLITSLLLNEQAENGSISLKKFYLRRIFRILPAFYFMLLVVFLLGQYGFIHLPLSDLAAAASFSWNYIPTTKTWWLGHSWSLSVEEQFYLFWPALIIFSGITLSKKWPLFFILMAPLSRIATYFLLPDWRGRMSIMLHTRIDTIMFGCLLALFWNHDFLKKLLSGKYSQLSFIGALFFLIILSPLLAFKFGGTYMMTVGYSLEGLAMAWIIAWLVHFPKTVVGRVLNSAYVARVGVLSYSLYLWQQFFLTNQNTTYLGQFPLNIISVFLMAELSYRFIEKPFFKYKPV